MIYYESNDELYHYGVLGMKWGVHRATSKSGRNQRLERKASKQDKKAAELYKKAEKAHAKYDLGKANKAAAKAGKYAKKAAKTDLKIAKTDNEFKKTMLEKKSAKLKYKSAKNTVVANRYSRISGYGIKAAKLAARSDARKAAAAKARMKIANNDAYIAKMKRKASEVSEADLKSGYTFVKTFLDESNKK
jgi:hypothetical protein